MDLTRQELAKFLEEKNIPRFHAGNIFAWFYQKNAQTFDPMTNLSKKVRKDLQGKLLLELPEAQQVQHSSDGTKKVLFHLDDGCYVETVIMVIKGHVTLCVSSQVGCRMGCRFCLTGKQHFERHLLTREIVGQVVACKRIMAGEADITNIVLMGMGEPLDNYDNVMRAIRILYDDFGMQLSWRRMTLSTAGWLPGLKKLNQEGQPEVSLAISLNATEDETRSAIMPVNKKYPLEKLMAAVRKFPMRGHRRITIEYVILGGVNDSLKDADRMAKLLQGIRCIINLIAFNPYEGAGYKAPTENTVLAFQERLRSHGYRAIIRHSRGADISAACGQLRGKVMQKSADQTKL